MKRLVVTLSLIALPFAASASPELAGDWGAKAADLHEETSGLITEIDTKGAATLPSDYETDIARFATTASRLGTWIDGNKGPSDLGCIFRGMAQEGEVQIDALDHADTLADRRASLVRLATMFADAETVSLAAIASARGGAPTPTVTSGVAMSCEADAGLALKALD